MLDTADQNREAAPAVNRPPRTRRNSAAARSMLQSQAETDGFQLVIDALKLNGIDTIFGLPGIPITDLTRKLQSRGPARDLLPP